MNPWFVLPPIAALIGWFTNFVAVRMIFRPHRPIRLPGFTLQGLLPKRRREFAESIGATVEDHLLSADDIKKLLEDPEVKDRLEDAAREKIDHFIQVKLIGNNPMLGAFLKGPFVDGLKDGLVKEVGVMLSEGVVLLGDHLDDNLQLKKIVQEKIEGFDMAKLEQIVLRVAKKELVAIEILGAVLGFIVGVGQLLLLQLL